MKFIKSIFSRKKTKYQILLENTTDYPDALGDDFWGVFRSVVTMFYSRLKSSNKFKSSLDPDEKYLDKNFTRIDYYAISIFLWAVIIEVLDLLEEDGIDVSRQIEFQKYIVELHLIDPQGMTDEEFFELINPDVIYIMLFMFQEEKVFLDIKRFVNEIYNSGKFSSNSYEDIIKLYKNIIHLLAGKDISIQKEYDDWQGGDLWWRDVIKKIEF